MGCGISKTALEEIESSVDVKALPQRSITSDKVGKQEETTYLSNNGPKSVSSPSERGFLKWVYVSNDRDKEVDREIRSYDNGQKIVCSSALIAQQLRTRVQEDEAAITKRVDPKTFSEKEILVERLGKEGVGEDKDDNLIREDSLIASPASPSFRVYCALRGSMSSHDEDTNDAEEKNKQPNGREKELESGPVKKGKKVRAFKNVLQRVGSPKIKASHHHMQKPKFLHSS